jgi:hypothetical protein
MGTTETKVLVIHNANASTEAQEIAKRIEVVGAVAESVSYIYLSVTQQNLGELSYRIEKATRNDMNIVTLVVVEDDSLVSGWLGQSTMEWWQKLDVQLMTSRNFTAFWTDSVHEGIIRFQPEQDSAT